MGGVDTYIYVYANPMNRTDIYGLDTYSLFVSLHFPIGGNINLGLMLNTGVFDIGVFEKIGKRKDGFEKIGGTIGFCQTIECRQNFDGLGVDLSAGFYDVGGNVSLSAKNRLDFPDGLSFEFGPQLGFEADETITQSFTARDLGRAIAHLIHGGDGKILGEGN